MQPWFDTCGLPNSPFMAGTQLQGRLSDAAVKDLVGLNSMPQGQRAADAAPTRPRQ